jgi:DNA-binding CsgD family transcriptional regulator
MHRAATRFSRKWATDDVPGISRILGERLSSQANATCIGVALIGRPFGKPSSCIFAHLRPSGGIMPPARRRSRLALTMAEREEVSRGIVEGQSVRAIARMLARAGSTVKHAMKGVPDIIIIRQAQFVGLQVKREDGRLSPEQLEFQKRCEEAGGRYHVVRSIDDVQALGL